MPQYPGLIDLSTLTGSGGANPGFRVNGVAPGDRSGASVASAGDVNGDGFADLIIGARGAGGSVGASYVVFGSASGFDATFDLAGLDGTNGFSIPGIVPTDGSGWPVSSAGDVNGDGFADVIIGGFGPPRDPGSSYVVFGHGGALARGASISPTWTVLTASNFTAPMPVTIAGSAFPQPGI